MRSQQRRSCSVLYAEETSDGAVAPSSASQTGKALLCVAVRFFLKAFQHSDSRKIRVINTDQDKSYPKAIKDLKESGILPDSVEHRAVKYPNNIIEQDHRYIKRRVVASQHFREFGSASRTISGYETMNMIRKGQIKSVNRGDILGQIKFVHSLFGITA